ncbi:FdtA/QdtA family cupin domain-containing protein, partial [Proteus terrae]|uniref:sugar 3,4-ketoisomerase n=1 Tax=Proteus terrae TaxID=1574161 RepID=UPI002095184B
EKDVSRGFHAHKKLKQLAICLKGSCDFIMDDGKKREKITLTSPDVGLIIDAMQWHEMHNFSEDCIILVLADDVYDESDYIRDYETFQKSIITI